MNNIVILGVSGASGSGKSLLANTIVDEIGSDKVTVISEDAYYKHRPELSFEERNKINYDHPESMDHALLIQHLNQLRDGQSIDVPIYDYTTHLRFDKTRKINNHHIIVLEGILLFTDVALRERMNIRIFVDTSPDVCLIRRIRRDTEKRNRSLASVLKQYENTVRPMYLQFIEPSKRYADVIIPHGGENRIAIDMIKAKIKELL